MESRSWYEMEKATQSAIDKARALAMFEAAPSHDGSPPNRAARRRKEAMDRAEAKRKARVPA